MNKRNKVLEDIVRAHIDQSDPLAVLQIGQLLIEQLLAGDDATIAQTFFIPRRYGSGLILLPAIAPQRDLDASADSATKRQHAAVARSIADAQRAEWVGYVFEDWLNPEHTKDAAFVEAQLRSGVSMITQRGFSGGRRRGLVGSWEKPTKSTPFNNTAVFRQAVTESTKAAFREALRRLNPGIGDQELEAWLAECFVEIA